jgi:hypothetical protein
MVDILSESEIAYDDIVVPIHKNVLGVEISVNDSFGMGVPNSLQHGSEYSADPLAVTYNTGKLVKQ